MYILGIDTSCDWITLVLGKEDKPLDYYWEYLPRRHIEVLHPRIKDLVDKRGICINDIDLFIVVTGPGSFTGIRIGVTAVKGFAYALNKQCVSVISLDILAHNARNHRGKLIIPVIDARRNQVYTAIYENRNGKISRKSDYQLVEINKLIEDINSNTVLIGNGISSYSGIIKKYKHQKKFSLIEDEQLWHSQPGTILKLGYEKFQRYGGENVFDLKPFYIYPKECTIKESKKSENKS